jgi:hypothetical protein
VVGDSGGTLAEALVGEDWGSQLSVGLVCFRVDATSFSVSAMFELKFDNAMRDVEHYERECSKVWIDSWLSLYKLRRRHDELACDGFGATKGWGVSACGALSPTTDNFQRILVAYAIPQNHTIVSTGVLSAHLLL